MKDLIDRAPVLKAFKERTRKQLGTRKLAIMQQSDLEHISGTVVISGTIEQPRSGTSVRRSQESAPRGRRK
jgi:hypothetical protein